MVDLNGWAGYTRLFVLTAVLGAIGGLVFELMQARTGGQAGQVERPRRTGQHTDWGVWANVVVGAVAAVAAMWLLPPEHVVTVNAAGDTVTTARYEIVKVVSFSLIIGSAGSSFLAAMQARVLATAMGQQAAATQRVADTALTNIQAKIDEGVSAEALAGTVVAARAAVRALGDSGPGNPPPSAF